MECRSYRCVRLADFESQLPQGQRYVDALIPVDFLVKYGPGDDSFRQNICQDYATQKARYDQGSAAIDNRPQIQLAQLALSQPNAPSSAFPGLTNLQTIWFLAGATYRAGANLAPFYHLLGTNFDEAGMPLGLLYTSSDYFVNLSLQVAPFSGSWEHGRSGFDHVQPDFDAVR